MRAIDDLTQTITLGLAAAPTTAVQYVGTYATVDGVAVGIAGTLPDTNSVAINYNAKRRMLQPGRITQLTISNPAGNSAAAVTVTWRDDGPDPDEVIAAIVHQATIAAGGSAKYTEALGWQLFTAGGLVQGSDDWYAAVKKGLIPGHALVHKFGRNAAVGTGGEDIWSFTTIVWPTAAFTAEALSGSGNDTAAGSGAQQITISGLDANWAEQTETLEMNGGTAVIGTATWMRLNRAWVSRVGTYGGDNVSNITIRVSVGGTVHLSITGSEGQTAHGAYTVPLGKTAYWLSADLGVDSGKTARMIFYQVPNANDVATPFSGARRIVQQSDGVSGHVSIKPRSPSGPFVGPCDLWWHAIPSATAAVTVDFELLLVDD